MSEGGENLPTGDNLTQADKWRRRLAVGQLAIAIAEIILAVTLLSVKFSWPQEQNVIGSLTITSGIGSLITAGCTRLTRPSFGVNRRVVGSIVLNSFDLLLKISTATTFGVFSFTSDGALSWACTNGSCQVLALVITIFSLEVIQFTAGITTYTITCRRLKVSTNTTHTPPQLMRSQIQADVDLADVEMRTTNTSTTPSVLSDEVLSCIKRCQIHSKHIEIGQQIGGGFYGIVYKGTYQYPGQSEIEVGIKTLKVDTAKDSEVESFLQEGTMMMFFDHVNILKLIGVVYENDIPPMVVLPFMANGDLRSFIRKTEVILTFGDACHFAYQVSNGMAYLSQQRFVHRDLAARNCMVAGDYVIKIGDFGLARDAYSRDYYVVTDKERPLPMKWMSLEAMKEERFSTQSDVWSFGVLMWELLTGGAHPYPSISNFEVKSYLQSGQRLDKPNQCPQIIYNMMYECWYEDPEKRPTFTQLSGSLNSLLNPSTAACGDESHNYMRVLTQDISSDYHIYTKPPASNTSHTGNQSEASTENLPIKNQS